MTIELKRPKHGGTQAEYIDRLVENRRKDWEREAEEIIKDWARINEASVKSNLIPQYEETFRKAGLEPPFYFVHSYGEVTTCMAIINHRDVIAVSPDKPDVAAGFNISQLSQQQLPGRPLDIRLVLNSDLELMERVWRGFVDDVSPITPYWWPEDYPVGVADISDYSDVTGWQIASWNMEIVSPFEGGKIYGGQIEIPREFESYEAEVNFTKEWNFYGDQVSGYFKELGRLLIA